MLYRTKLVCLILYVVHTVKCHPDGADPDACNTREMIPGHHVTPITNSSTFVIEVTGDTYTPGGKDLDVVIRSVDKSQFRGFLLQARKNNGIDRLTHGTFRKTGSYSSHLCGAKGRGITHTRTFRDARLSILQLTWTPPSICDAQNIGDLVIQGSFVVKYSLPPHINIFSRVIRMERLNNTILCQHNCGVNCPTNSAIKIPSMTLSILPILIITGLMT